MMLFSRSSQVAPTITMTRRRFLVMTFLATLVAQIVVVYSIANAARTQGSLTTPTRAVSTFLLMLLLFVVVAAAGGVVLKTALWVLRIPMANETSRQQRLVFSGIRLAFVLGVVLGVPFLTRDLWMKSEYISMLPLPLFYALLALYVWRSGRQTSVTFSRNESAEPARGRATEPRGASSAQPVEGQHSQSSTWFQEMAGDTGAIPVDASAR